MPVPDAPGEGPHIHGDGCVHDDEPPFLELPMLGGPAAPRHDHDAPDHGGAHVHGPDCDHGHSPAAQDTGHAHVHGPGCGHDRGAHEAPAADHGHVHGPGCTHDHGGSDHGHAHEEPAATHGHVHGPDCAHDHGGHEAPPAAEPHGHVHGPDCAHGHAHEESKRRPVSDRPLRDEDRGGGHTHGGVPCSGHSHAAHTHSHGHSHEARPERPPGNRPAESGGMACQLDLDILLPDETDEAGRFQKLEEILEAREGITQVHLRRDLGRVEVCAHYDPALVTLPQLVALIKNTGGEVAERYHHQVWFVLGLEAAQNGYALEAAVRRVPGVLSANVAYAAERLVAEFDTQQCSLGAIEEAAKPLGLTLERQELGHTCSIHAHGGGLAPQLEMPLVVAAGSLLALGWISSLILPGVPMVATALYILALVAGGFFPVRGALGSLRHGVFDIETLMVLAGAGAGLLGAWFEGAFLLFLFSLGHALEHRAMEKARNAIHALGNLRPDTARVKEGEAFREVPVDDVIPGQVVLVRPGDRVPLDGVIADGETQIDQATVTGESIPVARGVGEAVFAGTINTQAAIEVTVTKISGESTVSRIIDMVAEAETQKSPTQRFAKKTEQTFVPIVLVAAPALTLFLFFVQHLSLNEAVLRGISLLVAASPCALAIATPAAVLSAVACAARNGVLVKGGAHLETLGKVESIAFDKTGTLTVGKPKIVSVTPIDGDETELLITAAAAESHSSHPLAEAVVHGVRERGLAFPDGEDTEAVHGKGLHSVVGGKRVSLGNLDLFAGSAVPERVAQLVGELQAKGQTTIIVRSEERFLGVIGLADTLRLEARTALQRLRDMGVRRKVMLSGDNATVARAIATEVGIEEIRAPLLPEGKVTELRTLAKGGGVAMIGDGVNDAPALAAASVGVAMGGVGSDAALETADIVLMSEGLGKLPFAVRLARQSSAVIQQNLVVALGVSAVLVIASIFGWVQISQAVVLHEGSTLVVVANGLRLLSFRDS